MLLCTYHTCMVSTEALREAHSRFFLKTQKEEGLFQKHVRVGAPFRLLAAQRNQPVGSEVGLYRYLHFSFLHHPLSVSIITQLNKHQHFAGGRQADANEAEQGISCHKLLLGFFFVVVFWVLFVWLVFLRSLNIPKVWVQTFKAALKLSAYALVSCSLQLLTQAGLHCSSDRRMLFSHITKGGRQVRTQSVELTKLCQNSRESINYSNRVFTSLNSLVKKKNPEKYQKLTYLARHTGGEVSSALVTSNTLSCPFSSYE